MAKDEIFLNSYFKALIMKGLFFVTFFTISFYSTYFLSNSDK